LKLLLDANSIILLTQSGEVPVNGDEVKVFTTGIAAYELGNAVWKDLHIFKKLTEGEARVLLTAYHETLLRITVESQTELVERLSVLENADRYRLSFYDSSYLTAAIRLDATLVTEDKSLKRASKECGIPCSSARELST
jgi:predicted nucleic acid-binding protein